MRERAHFQLLNFGHFLDHLLMLVFATAAALVLRHEWSMSYAALVPYATPGFIAFGLFALPAGWLADRWSREGMMVVFFMGAGLSAMLAGLSRTPVEMAAALFLVGVFAAIYHPVGLALVYEGAGKAGLALALNGIWGNLGVGSAALVTGLLIDHGGWRGAFFMPGLVCVLMGCIYVAVAWPRLRDRAVWNAGLRARDRRPSASPLGDAAVRRIAMLVLASSAVAAIIFQSTTFALPKVFEERLTGIAASATAIGWITFLVFATGSLAQLAIGHLLGRVEPRVLFLAVASLEAVAFWLMPGLDNWAAVVVAGVFMIGAFGQIPINDYITGLMSQSSTRGTTYGLRFLISFSVLAATLPLIGFIHGRWGFDTLFRLLAGAAMVIALLAALLPATLSNAEPSNEPAE